MVIVRDTILSKGTYDLETFLEQYLAKNLNINSQADGVYHYYLTLEIGPTQTSVEVFADRNGNLERDPVFGALKKCLEEVDRPEYRGTHRLKITTDTIVSSYKIRLIE